MLSLFDAERHFSKIIYTEFRYAKYDNAEFHYVECHYVEYCYAECHYSLCHYANCRGTITVLTFYELKRNKEINCLIGRKKIQKQFSFFQIFGKILNLIRFIVS
jgi:hypothetical protein